MISSKDNRTIKDLRKLHTHKHRKKTSQFLIEGEHLIEEAIQYDQNIHLIILTEHFKTSLQVEQYKVLYVSENVMKSVSQLDTPPGLIAVLSYCAPKASSNRILALDGIQDPGNLGTLIRTADAFGFKQVILSEDTADPFSAKVLRSAQGSTFHINIQSGNILSVIEDFSGMTIGTSLEDAVYLEDFHEHESEEMLVVLGNEGQGTSQSVLDAVDEKVKVKMTGQSESLNVAIAGGIIMHHFKA